MAETNSGCSSNVGLARVSRNEWIEIDCDYKTQISERAQIVDSHSDKVLGITPSGRSPASELFNEIVFNHLPRRFPGIFSLSADRGTLKNNITKTSIPSKPASHETESVRSSLRDLAVSVVEDLFILRPDAATGKHHLCAFVACYPNGFQTEKLMGKPVSEIHAPVPLYREKLEMSVDRFFRTLKAGDFMRRFNVRFGLSNVMCLRIIFENQ